MGERIKVPRDWSSTQNAFARAGRQAARSRGKRNETKVVLCIYNVREIDHRQAYVTYK
jgi:hypothetical protein